MSTTTGGWPDGVLGALPVACPDCGTPVLITSGDKDPLLTVCVCCGATFTLTRLKTTDG
jgi:DNA-directed RNA polymerase subunit RPC12/RpoP